MPTVNVTWSQSAQIGEVTSPITPGKRRSRPGRDHQRPELMGGFWCRSMPNFVAHVRADVDGDVRIVCESANQHHAENVGDLTLPPDGASMWRRLGRSRLESLRYEASARSRGPSVGQYRAIIRGIDGIHGLNGIVESITCSGPKPLSSPSPTSVTIYSKNILQSIAVRLC
jgi:hypothetical protein